MYPLPSKTRTGNKTNNCLLYSKIYNKHIYINTHILFQRNIYHKPFYCRTCLVRLTGADLQLHLLWLHGIYYEVAVTSTVSHAHVGKVSITISTDHCAGLLSTMP
jgi:hypothetical protein